MQAHSRLVTLLADCRLYEAALPVLEDLCQMLPLSDPGRPEAMQRMAHVRAHACRKQAPDHYKLLGVNSGCEPDEVSIQELASEPHWTPCVACNGRAVQHREAELCCN